MASPMHYPLLALLMSGPADGPEIKASFDATFGLSWPEVGFGQLYATLAALEHEGLVEAQGYRRDQKLYELTTAGGDALAAWATAPVDGPEINDDLFLKLLVLYRTGHQTRVGNAQDLIEHQRQRYLQNLHDIHRALANGGVYGGPAGAGETDPMAQLLLEHAALRTEADLKWLDVCERVLAETPSTP